jgi:NCS1 family nucleobase:cation symporter-1
MSSDLRQRFWAKRKPSAWVIPRQKSTFADEDRWSNVDCDVTPVERRTWSTWTLLGFWFSDALNAQGWEGAASIIAVGLTWREAFYCLILGYICDVVPMVLNGAIGADLHINFATAARSSFGFYFSRFAVVVRMITALFWHGQFWSRLLAVRMLLTTVQRSKHTQVRPL